MTYYIYIKYALKIMIQKFSIFLISIDDKATILITAIN